MRSIPIFFLVLLSLASCQSNKDHKRQNNSIENQTKIEIPSSIESEKSVRKKENQISSEAVSGEIEEELFKDKNAVKITVNNESDYSEKFISNFKEAQGMKIESAEFKQEKLILNGKDTLYFPEIPKINENFEFTKKLESQTIKLKIKRTNYTSLKYLLEIVDSNKIVLSETGIADIGVFFFLGTESDYDDLTGESYFSTEFTEIVDSCFLNIRIGNIEDNQNGPLIAKINGNCNEKFRSIDLQNFPTLREK